MLTKTLIVAVIGCGGRAGYCRLSADAARLGRTDLAFAIEAGVLVSGEAVLSLTVNGYAELAKYQVYPVGDRSTPAAGPGVQQADRVSPGVRDQE